MRFFVGIKASNDRFLTDLAICLVLIFIIFHFHHFLLNKLHGESKDKFGDGLRSEAKRGK